MQAVLPSAGSAPAASAPALAPAKSGALPAFSAAAVASSPFGTAAPASQASSGPAFNWSGGPSSQADAAALAAPQLLSWQHSLGAIGLSIRPANAQIWNCTGTVEHHSGGKACVIGWGPQSYLEAFNMACWLQGWEHKHRQQELPWGVHLPSQLLPCLALKQHLSPR